MDTPKLDFAGVILLGLDPTHGPYIYHQYPPDIAVAAATSYAPTTTANGPSAAAPTAAHDSLLGSSAAAGESQGAQHPQTSDGGGGLGGMARPASSFPASSTSVHSVFATIKNFAEVFLPRPELTGRVCWHYEADTNHIVMYMPLEFVGSQYRRNLLRMTVCFVFACAPMMTTSASDVEDELNAYSLALLNVAELLKDAEVRYGYLFHYMDPMGDYYDMNRPLRSSIESGGGGGGAAMSGGTAGSSTLKTAFSSTGGTATSGWAQQSAKRSVGATPLGVSFDLGAPGGGERPQSLSHQAATGGGGSVVSASPMPSVDLDASSQRQPEANHPVIIGPNCDGDADQHDEFFPRSAERGKGVQQLSTVLMSTESFDVGPIANNNAFHQGSGSGGGASSFDLDVTARDARSPDILRWIPCTTQGALAAENAFIFSVSPPAACNNSSTNNNTNSSDAPRQQLGVSLYDLSFVVEKVFDCMVGTCEAIPLSEHSSIPIHCARRVSKSIFIYPEQRVVPIVSPGEVLEWMGDEVGWGDLAITDVFFLVDGIRTVAEIAEHFCSSGGTASSAMTPSVRAALCAMKPVEEVNLSGCKRRSNKSTSGGAGGVGQRNAAALGGGGAGGRLLDPEAVLPAEAIPHEVVLTLEALQHLHHCNLVRMLDPIVGANVYVCSPAFYAVLSDEDHPGRWQLGLKMLAVQAAVTQCARRLSDIQLSEGNGEPGSAATPADVAAASTSACETPERQKIRGGGAGRPPVGSSVRSPVPTVSFEGTTGVAVARSKQQPVLARVDSGDGLETSLLPWEAMSMTGTFGASAADTSTSARGAARGAPSSAAVPPPLPFNADDDEFRMETLEERTRIGAVFNMAALRGYPPMTAAATTQPADADQHNNRSSCSCCTNNAVARMKEMDRLEEDVCTAASAALCALVKFQFVTMQSVCATMRASPVWGTAFHQWCSECMITLVEFGALNGWLRLHKKM